jgi:hypothetical protein
MQPWVGCTPRSIDRWLRGARASGSATRRSSPAASVSGWRRCSPPRRRRGRWRSGRRAATSPPRVPGLPRHRSRPSRGVGAAVGGAAGGGHGGGERRGRADEQLLRARVRDGDAVTARAHGELLPARAGDHRHGHGGHDGRGGHGGRRRRRRAGRAPRTGHPERRAGPARRPTPRRGVRAAIRHGSAGKTTRDRKPKPHDRTKLRAQPKSHRASPPTATTEAASNDAVAARAPAR